MTMAPLGDGLIPRVSVVMPVFNCEQYLAAAIDSILKQTFTDIEILLVYDESRDGTNAVIDRYLALDPRIRIISGPGTGLIGALNQGLREARGEYIARMDADDLSFPHRLQRQIELLDRTGADICGGHYFVIDESGYYLDACIVPLTYEAIIVTLAQTVPFAHGSVMLRSEFLEKHGLSYGGAGLNAAEDYSFWVQMFECGAKFENVDDWLFSYRDHGSSASKAGAQRVGRDRGQIAVTFMGRHRDALRDALTVLVSRRGPIVERESIALVAAVLLLRYGQFNSIQILRRLSKRTFLIGCSRALRLLIRP